MNPSNVKEIVGDIFLSECQTLIIPVNARGAMGAGLARAFRDRVPGLYNWYRHCCKSGMFCKNTLLRYKWPNTDKQVICLATKDDWWDPSNRDLVLTNLSKLVSNVERLGITSIACPALGCGLGELSYEDIKDDMVSLLEISMVPCEIILWERKKKK